MTRVAKSQGSASRVHVEFSTHLTCIDLARELSRATSQIARSPSPVGLLVDCRKMQDYETEARSMFLEWNVAHRREVRGVALVSPKASLRVVIGAMALSSGQKMRVFETLETAEAWMGELSVASP